MLNSQSSATKFWFLEGRLSDGNTLFIKINTFPFVIGRDKKCNLFLSSKNVSRRHSEIFLQGEHPAVRDLKSMNGTFVNGRRVTGSVPLRAEDTLGFADQEFKVYFTDNKTADGIKKTNLFRGPKKQETFAHFYKLSKREEEVLFFLLKGKSSKSIAGKLFISEGTAKNHVLNIFKKTGTHSRFELLTLFNTYPAGGKKK
jgi:DNA-binding CsgD family transcriptional regulator